MDSPGAMESHVVERKAKPSCLQHVGDFANIFKAFIGANYLTIPFNFRQSGVALGGAGLVFIAVLTDHCCQLITKCKYAAIQRLMGMYRAENEREGGSISEEEMDTMEKRLLRNLTYGDIGRICFGKTGLVIVNVCLLFTQFGFCVSYFIFVGNTFYSLFPTHNVTQDNVVNTTYMYSPPSDFSDTRTLEGKSSDDILESYPPYRDSLVGNMSNSNQTSSWSTLLVSNAPRLEYLILVPLPFFIVFAIIRRMRHLGVISVFADISIFIGCVCVLSYLLVRFTLSQTYKLVKASTFPIFFGGVTAAFEGIGTILPIEASMEGNRHNFPFFLHGAIFLLSFILSVFGVLGYLRFGELAEQTINSNITPLDSPISRTVNITLCVGILLTFPLQMYPVIEIAEGYIFAEGRCLGPKSRAPSLRSRVSDDDIDQAESDEEVLIDTSATAVMPVAVEIPHSVAAWKRNVFRVCIVLLACGIAVLCRNFYAYFSAFVGAVGSTMLAYILPCVFHLKLTGFRLPWRIWIKDVVIIIVGICGGVMSVYTVVRDVASALHTQ